MLRMRLVVDFSYQKDKKIIVGILAEGVLWLEKEI
jgi:hypothetical protein